VYVGLSRFKISDCLVTVLNKLDRRPSTSFVNNAIDLPPKFLSRCASAVLAHCLAVLSVCLSVTSQGYIEIDEAVELVFGKGASFDLSCHGVAW